MWDMQSLEGEEVAAAAKIDSLKERRRRITSTSTKRRSGPAISQRFFL
jgi:hypothetical protein